MIFRSGDLVSHEHFHWSVFAVEDDDTLRLIAPSRTGFTVRLVPAMSVRLIKQAHWERNSTVRYRGQPARIVRVGDPLQLEIQTRKGPRIVSAEPGLVTLERLKHAEAAHF